MLIPIPFLIFSFYAMIASSNFIFINYFIGRIFFTIGLISIGGIYYGAISLGMSASYIEKLVTSPKPLSSSLLQAKYYLNSILSFIITITLITIQILNGKVESMEIVASYLFSIGYVYHGMFKCTLLSYAPIDIKATSIYNWQGFTLSNLFFPALFLLATMSIIAIVYWLLGKSITLIIISIVGLCFIVTCKLWINSIGKEIERTKYHRLECFRENNY